VTYALGTASSIVQSTDPASRKSLPILRKQKKNVISVSSKRTSSRDRTLAETREEVLRQAALEEMFIASRKRFLAIAYSILRNADDAEDAVQEAYLSAYRHLRGFEGRSALKTWFTRIVLNASLMIQRKRRQSTIEPLSTNGDSHEVNWVESIPASEPDPEMVHAERETIGLINGVLGKMKPMLRQALTITYLEELSSPEACAKLGVSAGAFKARLFRAKRQVVDLTERALVAPIHKIPFRRL
jgi:RNA polymerase sigma-70 factor (ECF subfamily)